jgi:HSP20 family molecular chaperone IbpA
VTRFWTSPFEDFDRAFDQLFEELLIGRWRPAVHRLPGQHAIVMDCGNHYEVQLSTAGLDPQQLSIEVNENRLTVHGPTVGGGKSEQTFTFETPVDRESVTVRWSEHVLFVFLPKLKKRSVAARKTKPT